MYKSDMFQPNTLWNSPGDNLPGEFLPSVSTEDDSPLLYSSDPNDGGYQQGADAPVSDGLFFILGLAVLYALAAKTVIRTLPKP